jgi:CheY-like chemotaxis protein
MNLITNASDAIGERSGIVTLATSLITADRTYLEETLLDDSLEPGDYVCLQVSDTGIGMDAATQARIFEPFFTTKFTGRGLGLAAVQGILHAHRGSLKVYSEVGRGSTFKLLLPAADGPPDLESEVPRLLGSTSSATILVVDDEPVVRNMTKRVLTNAGYRVLVAGDGEEGVEVFRTHRAEIGAVILDVTMPRMGGEEAFRHLRSIEPRVRVILVSGYSEQEATSQFAGKGLSAFLEKPYRPTVLLEKLRAVLAEAE